MIYGMCYLKSKVGKKLHFWSPTPLVQFRSHLLASFYMVKCLRGDVMKKISFAIMILLIVFSLASCKNDDNDDSRTVVEKDWIYDFIGIKSIEVNGELFTTFCKQEKESELWNTFGAARSYIDESGNEYRAYLISPCLVFYDDTMYHGFDLLENGLLTIEELELLEFPFSEESDN